MSEVVAYSGWFSGMKNDSEVAMVMDLAKSFQQAEVDRRGEEIYFHVADGWRGSALSCEDIVERHFGHLLLTHRNIALVMQFRYIEQAPVREKRWN